MKPVRILLSGKENIQYYVDAIERLDGMASVNDPEGADGSYDGLLLCGGRDLDPSRYGEEVAGARNMDLERDASEWALLRAYIQAEKPIMGICRGHQLINVFFGGSLWQDIPEGDLHVRKNDRDAAHPVVAAEDSILYGCYGKEFSVNSSHHQAIKKLGRDLRPTAYWEGKYMEAIEHVSLPIFAVQWHPERMCFGQRRDDTVDGAKLFEHFLALCRERQPEPKIRHI